MEQTPRTYRLNAQEKGVSLELESEAQLPQVRGNWDLLLQVFDDLVGNGLKFTPPGGQLTLRACPWPDHCAIDPSTGPGDAPSCPLSSPLPKVRIEITDTGAGISEMDQERIFERFYRVENAVHTEVVTGLDLSIVRGIVEKHGCTVQMVSALGVGTTFWFDLPCEEADSDELAVQAERRRYQGERVLGA
jgi:two-component system sensor histidine kinase NblS